MYLKKNLKNLKKKYLQYDGDLNQKMLKMLKKTKEENSLNLQPIVYYIDPSTPDKWKKYIKAGIDDWQVAFEAAGWKNAIRENTGLKMIQQ
jgi:hypothetical protein